MIYLTKKNCKKLSGYTHFDRNETGYYAFNVQLAWTPHINLFCSFSLC